MANPTAELRYHITIFDETGAKLHINNLDRVALDDFNQNHETDDLDFVVEYDWTRTHRVRATA